MEFDTSIMILLKPQSHDCVDLKFSNGTKEITKIVRTFFCFFFLSVVVVCFLLLFFHSFLFFSKLVLTRGSQLPNTIYFGFNLRMSSYVDVVCIPT